MSHVNNVIPSLPKDIAMKLHVAGIKLIGSWGRRSMAMAGEVTRHGQAHPYSWSITIVSLRSKESEE